MASSASSLHFLSVTPQTIYLSKPTVSNLTSLAFPTASSLKLSSFSCSSSAWSFKPSFSSSRFGRNVALSTDFDQIDAVDEEGEGVLSDESEPNFSPDLKLFVGNLPFSVDSAALAALFERAGNVEMVEVIYDKFSGRSRGFGFVTMSTVEEVEAAAQQFNGYELDGRVLRVNSGPPPPRRERERERENSPFRGSRGGENLDTNRLHVGNLAWGVDNLALETLFSEQGKVVEAKVVYDRESGRSRGFGFVTYSTADEVNSAIEMLNGVDLNGRAIRVSPAESRPRRDF